MAAGPSTSISPLHYTNVKELLKELAMVEDEITQLENQIKSLEDDRKREWEMRHGPHRSLDLSLPPVTGYPPFLKPGICITAKGGTLHSHTGDKEEKIFEGVFTKKFTRLATALNPPSPLHNLMHLSPKREGKPKLLPELVPKALPSPQGSSSQNKISETIMKCLISIFVRLHRASRALDMEKVGPVSRITHSSLTSISFRADAVWNPKMLSGVHKDTRQPDPYGIFEPEGSLKRDIGHYKNLVVFTANSLDPKCISLSNFGPLFQKLSMLMGCLERVDLRGMTHRQELAFWINMYNACVMNAYLKYGVPSSRETRTEFIDKATLNIGGRVMDAQTMECAILRNPTTINEVTCSGLEIGLESRCPNVTFALCSGSHSSPAVRIYRAEGVEAELEKARTEYLQAAVIVTTSRRIVVPGLVAERAPDIGRDSAGPLLAWLCRRLPASGTLRKSILECLRGTPPSILQVTPFDFEFRYLLFI